jgi:hypothetical protein
VLLASLPGSSSITFSIKVARQHNESCHLLPHEGLLQSSRLRLRTALLPLRCRHPAPLRHAATVVRFRTV